MAFSLRSNKGVLRGQPGFEPGSEWQQVISTPSALQSLETSERRAKEEKEGKIMGCRQNMTKISARHFSICGRSTGKEKSSNNENID